MAETTAQSPARMPFDLVARRRARDRAQPLIAGYDQVLAHVEEELLFRAGLLGETPEGPELRLGLLRPPPEGSIAADPSFALARQYHGVQCDEELLPFADNSFARITAFMTLHGANDLPGALILMRRALKPGGRFLTVLPAGSALPEVREAFLQVDAAAGGGVSPRIGPTLDPAEAAGLLQRAGFQDPVAELSTLNFRVQSLASLAQDLRRHGETGWLTHRGKGLTTPRRWMAAEAEFAVHADDDGRIPVTAQFLYLTARAA